MQTPNPTATSFPSLPTSLSSQIDLLISLELFTWPVLTLCLANAWGGSAKVSSDKREWLAGAISDLLSPTDRMPQLHDVADLEEVLLQAMLDEFEVVVDDESAADVARNIWVGVGKLREGDIGASRLPDLYARWVEKQSKGGKDTIGAQIVRGKDEEGEETDWDEDDEEEEWNGFADDQTNGDVEMDEAPPLVRKEKAAPEIDDEGFTKVVGKRNR